MPRVGRRGGVALDEEGQSGAPQLALAGRQAVVERKDLGRRATALVVASDARRLANSPALAEGLLPGSAPLRPRAERRARRRQALAARRGSFQPGRTNQRANSSGLVQQSNTSVRGALKLRVITISRWPSERTATCGLFTVVTSGTPLLHLFALQFIEQLV